jgi:hypothetical protein
MERRQASLLATRSSRLVGDDGNPAADPRSCRALERSGFDRVRQQHHRRVLVACPMNTLSG